MAFQGVLQKMIQQQQRPIGSPPTSSPLGPPPWSVPSDLPQSYHRLADPKANPGMHVAPTISPFTRPALSNVSNVPGTPFYDPNQWQNPNEVNVNLYNAGLMADRPSVNPRALLRPGSVSTIHSGTFEIDPETARKLGVPAGSIALIPTVIANDPNDPTKGGQLVLPPDAYRHFAQTGEHLGIFESEEAAHRYEEAIHDPNVLKYARPPAPTGGP